MTRSKVKLSFIVNESARKATFKKRKKGLLKKVSELSTLCGISACAVIFGPYDEQPDVWPSQSEAHHILTEFQSLPEMEQTKKMLNQEVFIRQRIARVKEQLMKLKRENRYKEINVLMNQYLEGKASIKDVNANDLRDMTWLLDGKTKEIIKKMEKLSKITDGQSSSSSVQAAAAAATTTITTEAVNISTGNLHQVGGYGPMNMEQMQAAAMEAFQRQASFLDVMNNPPPPHHPRQMLQGGSSSFAVGHGDNNTNVAWAAFHNPANFFH